MSVDYIEKTARTASSPFQYRALRDWTSYESGRYDSKRNKYFGARANVIAARLIELVEGGLTLREATKEVPSPNKGLAAMSPEVRHRLLYVSAQNRLDRGPQTSGLTQRELEGLVRLLTVGQDGDFDLSPPFHSRRKRVSIKRIHKAQE
jgi:hypothetical protein